MRPYCLDTQILIWGIQGFAKKSQQHMIERAVHFFEVAIEQTKVPIIIPSVVLAEFMVKIPSELKPKVLKECESRFHISPFDALAAVEYSRIRRELDEKGILNSVRDAGRPRQAISVDLQIIATAVVRRASALYTTDKRMRVMAEGFVNIRELPPVPAQQNLQLEPLIDNGKSKS